MDEADVIATLTRHWEHAGSDEDIAHEMYHDDVMLEFPQGKERFVGKQNLMGWRKQFQRDSDSRSGASEVGATYGSPRTSSATTELHGATWSASSSSEETRSPGRPSTSTRAGRPPSGVLPGDPTGRKNPKPRGAPVGPLAHCHSGRRIVTLEGSRRPLHAAATSTRVEAEWRGLGPSVQL